METVLIKRKSPVVDTVIKSKIQSIDNLECVFFSALNEISPVIEAQEKSFFLAILELRPNDTDSYHMIDYFDSNDIPVIIFSDDYTEEVRSRLMSHKILDYIIKDEYLSETLIKTIKRIYKNRKTKLLIVDDSVISRRQIAKILVRQQFVVYEAPDGQKALDILKNNRDINLIITDYNMPGMNGIELIKKVRQNYTKSQLAIIGFSAVDSPYLSAKLLKSGANDFLFKSFIAEELNLRVVQNLEMLEYIEAFKDLSNIDYLTQLYNRRFFFEMGNKMLENAKRKHLHLSVAMLDIDHFKKVNDTYGHDVGDLVIKHVANTLTNTLRKADIISRYGGEEFAVMAINVDTQSAWSVFDRLRTNIETPGVVIGKTELKITVSIGVVTKPMNTLQEYLDQADKLLYEAKESGRNTVTVD